MSDFSELPVLDAGALTSGNADDMQQFILDFRHAYGTVGFGYIVNHGIDPALIDAIFDASKTFHALPLEQKMSVALDANHRGFIPINTSTDVNSKLADVKKPNQSESFMMMREDAPGSEDVRNGAFLAGPNQWPDLAGFREVATTYHDALTRLGGQLMQVAFQSIGAEPEALMGAFERPTTWLRLLHYPPQPAMSADDLYGSAPHTDFGCLTILAQDDIGGLQVRTTDGIWIDAPAIPDSFVVNVGDMLHHWSNGLLKSTPHRVINRSGRERYSCPFFYDPHVSTNIAPLPCCITPERPARYEALNFGDYLRSELQAGYDQHKKQSHHVP